MDTSDPTNIIQLRDLKTLVKADLFKDAAGLCNSAIALGRDPIFWKTQLAYISFLNEEDDEVRYNAAPTLFTSLVESNPDDANSHFWLGYIIFILFNDKETAKSHLFQANRIDAEFFYCDLVLAGFSETQSDEKLEHLENVLKQKPNLYRGLIEVSELFIQLGQLDKAKSRLNALLNSPPYVENDFGLMNDYINEVLTGAYHPDDLKHKAEAMIKTLA